MTTIGPRLSARRRDDAPVARRRSRSSPARVLVVLWVLGVAGTLAACHTTQGAGEDLSAAGDALAESADTNKRY
jgi:predicted small secreted protein